MMMPGTLRSRCLQGSRREQSSDKLQAACNIVETSTESLLPDRYEVSVELLML